MQSITLGGSRIWRITSLVLVRGETSSSTTTTRASSSSAAAQARNIGALGSDFDVASLEDALVQDEGLGHQARLGKLDIGVAR
jgi:hypothetical protein